MTSIVDLPALTSDEAAAVRAEHIGAIDGRSASCSCGWRRRPPAPSLAELAGHHRRHLTHHLIRAREAKAARERTED